MTRKLYFLDGHWHVSGRSCPHTVFQGTPDDPKPHALVGEAFGEHLMTVEPGRYEWADHLVEADDMTETQAPTEQPTPGRQASTGQSSGGGLAPRRKAAKR